ncbi:hypothetical protein LRS12_03205 [Sphingomonas sp. J344]|nr:hypothetical protein [Sphingomonas sp. J344]MCR5869846.1 hypothetical protein [Sphingomonas sp. J344]
MLHCKMDCVNESVSGVTNRAAHANLVAMTALAGIDKPGARTYRPDETAR